MASLLKEITVYPYQYSLDGIGNDAKELLKKFDVSNIAQNITEYAQDRFLLVVIDEISNNFVFGRFLKLRNDAPIVINTKDGTQRTVDILDEENIIDQSHFVMNVVDNLIFGEYNFEAVRHFGKPLSYYLNKILDVSGNRIFPLPDVDTFEKLRGEEELNVFRLRVAQQNLEFLEKKFNISVIGGLLELATDNETTFEIVVKKSRKKGSLLDKEKVLTLAKKLKDEEAPLEALKVETDDIVYDLINKNLVNFKVSIKNNNRIIDSDDFYFKTRNLYERQAPSLIKILKRN